MSLPQPSSQRCEPGSVNIAVAPWPAAAPDHDVVAAGAAVINALNRHLASRDYKAVGPLFLPESYWRDHLGLGWALQTIKGRHNIVSLLESHSTGLREITLDTSSTWRSPQIVSFDGVGGTRGIRLYHKFKSRFGAGRGVARLMREGAEWKIWTFSTSLEEIAGHEEAVGPRRSHGVQHGAFLGRENWLDRRAKEFNFEQDGPEVLIIGAGQAGLAMHARLKMLGVPALAIETNDAIGDNWRKRYRQLVLHDPVWYDHMPYIHFPQFWPVFTPKDKLAEFFESYAKLLELNVWTKTTLVSSHWNSSERRWTVKLERLLAGGSTEKRTFHPAHIIQATGHSGQKNYPFVRGMDAFEGDILGHSSDFPGAKPKGKGRKAVVVGSCNSAHDICHDYYEKGYDVTMVQRSTTCVVSSEAITEILLGSLYHENGPPVEDADLAHWSLPSEVLKAEHVNLAKRAAERDVATLRGLQKAGFHLDMGPDDSGLYLKYLQRGGGYYIDVGASRLIAEGKIKIKQGREVAEVLPRALKLSDGEELPADEIIFATGYQNMRSRTREIFGDDVADAVGDVWGFNEQGEMRVLWGRSGHPGLWLHGGNLAMCRYYSRIVALQIKAELLGLTS